MEISEILFGGINGDHIDDLVIKLSAHYWGYRSKGDGGFASTPVRLWASLFASADNFIIRDANLDGFLDIFRTEVGAGATVALDGVDYFGSPAEPDAAIQCPREAYCASIYLSGNGYQNIDKLAKVQTPDGAGVHFKYGPSYEHPDNYMPHVARTLEQLTIAEWEAFDEYVAPTTIFNFE
ncbi:MAG: hypothetical protein GY841_20390, partial [FCB group bacterium]|nr:hypothetical protein [FCB group bacterium]